LFDGLKRKLAGGAIQTLLKSLATSKDTQTTITGIIAGAVLAIPGLDWSKVIAGDPVQLAHLAAGLCVAGIGYLATKQNHNGHTSVLGGIAAGLYASSGGVDAFVTAIIIGALGHNTNQPTTAVGPPEAKATDAAAAGK
jgi:hypothetical protein